MSRWLVAATVSVGDLGPVGDSKNTSTTNKEVQDGKAEDTTNKVEQVIQPSMGQFGDTDVAKTTNETKIETSPDGQTGLTNSSYSL